MKLLEILQKDLSVFPKGMLYAVQDDDGEIKFGKHSKPELLTSGIWYRRESWDCYCITGLELAEDWDSAIVTKDMLENDVMRINIEEYLTEEEMKEIAEQEFRKRISHQSKESLERIINNSAYQVVWSAVDESLDGEAIGILKEKVIEIIGDMSAFNVFATPNAWDRKENMAHSILVQAVKDNYENLAIQVENQLRTLSKTQIAKIAAEVMKEKLSKIV